MYELNNNIIVCIEFADQSKGYIRLEQKVAFPYAR